MSRFIKKVHYGDANSNNTKDIVEVMYSFYADRSAINKKSVSEVVSDINRGEIYYTAPNNAIGAEVEVYDKQFIRTIANAKASDNLENLPQY